MALIFDYKQHAKSAGIYRIRNLRNGKFYIGSTGCFSQRANEHRKQLAGNKHRNLFLQRSYNKDVDFVFEVLEITTGTRLERLAVEQTYLDKFWDGQKQCYNIASNAFAVSRAGSSVLSAESRRRISATVSSQMTPERRKQHSETMRAKFHNPEYAAANRAFMQKLAAEREYTKRELVSPTGERVVVSNLSLFAAENGLRVECIHKMLRGEDKHYRGWRLFDGTNDVPMPAYRTTAKRHYSLLSPDGMEHSGTNISAFIRQHPELSRFSLQRLLDGTIDAYKGWKLFRDMVNAEVVVNRRG